MSGSAFQQNRPPKATPVFQTPPATRKRLASCTSTNTPNKKARLQAIQAGLLARARDKSSSGPTDELPFTQATSETAPDAQSRSNSGHYSFLGLLPTQGSDSDEVPSTPKRPGGGQRLFGLYGAASSTLFTPPLSADTPARHVDPSGPVTPTRHRGRERAGSTSDKTVAAYDHNPFDDTFLNKLDQDAQTNAGPACTPTTSERIAKHILGLSQTILMHAGELDKLEAVKYIMRLERQKNTLTAKNEHVCRLMASLKAQLGELNERVSCLSAECQKKDEMIASLVGSLV